MLLDSVSPRGLLMAGIVFVVLVSLVVAMAVVHNDAQVADAKERVRRQQVQRDMQQDAERKLDQLAAGAIGYGEK